MIDDNFDGDKILSEYESMSKDEVIDLLGTKYSEMLKQRLSEGNITFDEFTQLCHEALPNYPEQRINWIRNMIYNKLSKKEGFNMIESDPIKREQYAKVEGWKERINNGTLSNEDLQSITDTAFGKDSIESRAIYNNLSNKSNQILGNENQNVEYDATIQSTNNGNNLPARQNRFSRFFNQVRSRFARRDTNSQSRNPFSKAKRDGEEKESQYEETQIQSKKQVQEKKSWELEPEEKARIQRETAEIAKRFRKQEEQQKQAPTQEMQQGNMQQDDYTQIQQGQIPQQIPQQPMQDFGGMEL